MPSNLTSHTHFVFPQSEFVAHTCQGQSLPDSQVEHHTTGQALRVRWLWLQFTDPGRCWAALPCPEDRETVALFHKIDHLGQYSSSSTYAAVFLGQASIPGAKQLWKVRAPGKCHFFFWTVLHGRAWTGERRYRHGLQDSDSCSLCTQDPETVDHLLVGCVFSREF
jgi:hypothetical protein